jgi:hypothetical protein
MSKSAKKLSKKAKNIIVIFSIVLFAVLLVFAEVIRPNQDAKAYTARLNSASQPLNSCFEKLADTTSLDIYYAPDITIQDRQKDAKTITTQVDACRAQLKDFNTEARDLLNLHLAGYTQTYHEAKVNQRQAYDVIGQSNDVLNQYADLATFLSNYYEHIGVFLDYFNNLQTIEKAYPYSYPDRATVATLSSQASDLHKRAAAIRALPTTASTASFADTKTETADMFDAYAAGFDNVVKGYTNYSDYYRSLGYKQVDAAVATYDAKVVTLPFEQLKASYIPKQVQQLPVKVKNLLAAQSE